MKNSNNARKQIVDPAARRGGTDVVDTNGMSLESSLFIYGLHVDAIKESTLKEIVERVEKFRTSSAIKVEEIASAHAKSDVAKLEGLAERLAEMCSQMGAVSMLRLCYQIQIGARHGSEITSLIRKLKVENQNFNENVSSAS